MDKVKKEDDFVGKGRHLWHATCFDFEGCGRNIAKHASAGRMGRPCCADCFHPSLKRSEGTHLRTTSIPLKEPKRLARAAWGVCCADKVWNEDAMVDLLYQSLRSVSVSRTRI
jgi:hypothetical protein